MKIGDVYYEKHTVVGINKRNGGVSETDVEIVKVIPIDVLDKIRIEIEKLKNAPPCFDDMFEYKYAVDDVLAIIDKYKAEKEEEE